MNSEIDAARKADNERVARLMAYVTPLGYSSALALIQAETKLLDGDGFHDRMVDALHNAGLIFHVIPDEGDDEQWVAEVPLADLMMLAERAMFPGEVL